MVAVARRPSRRNASQGVNRDARHQQGCVDPKQKWGPALLPAPTAPSTDMSVFASQITPKLHRLSILTHQLRRRFPSAAARREPRLFPNFASRRKQSSTWVRSCLDPKTKTTPMFHGPSWDDHFCVPLCSCCPEEQPKPRRAKGRSSLPAPLPSWPRIVPEGTSPLPAGGDRFFGHLPHLLAVAGLLGRLGPPSRSPDDHAPSLPSRAKRKMGDQACG